MGRKQTEKLQTFCDDEGRGKDGDFLGASVLSLRIPSKKQINFTRGKKVFYLPYFLFEEKQVQLSENLK